MNRVLRIITNYKDKRNSVVFKSMFRSIVFAILLPIIIAIAVAVMSLNRIENEMEKTKLLIFDKIVNEVNRNFTDVYSVNNRIKSSPLLRKYARTTKRNYWEEYEIQKFIKDAIEGRTNLEMAYVYFNQYDYVVSNLDASESLHFHSKYCNSTYETWLNQLNNWQEDKQDIDGVNTDNVIISTIEGSYGEGAQITSVLQLKNSYFEDIISELCLDPNDRVLIYNEGVTISTFEKEETQYILQEMLQSGDKVSENMIINEIKYDIISRYSSKYGFNFVYASPENTLVSSLAFTKWYGIGAIGLCIIFSLILSFSVANENYKPIKKILFLMNAEKRNGSNEYAQIETCVGRYIQHNNDLTVTLNQYEAALGRAYLEKILLGKIPHLESIKEGIKLYNLGFDSKYFVVLLVDISQKDPDSKSLFFDEIGGTGYIKNFINTNLSFIKTFHILEESDEYICIINGDSDNTAYFKQDIVKESEKIKGEIETLEHLQCNIYISNVFTEITKLYEEYTKLKKEKCHVETAEGVGENIDVKNLSIDGILEIIKENASDCNLSVASIADILDITPAYLSRYFKLQTEVGLLDYIHRFRIMMSKELIKEDSDIKIYEVAKMTGFYNVSTLIRVFKKHEGMTPGQYRDSI